MPAPSASNIIIPGRGAIFTGAVGATPPDYHILDPYTPPADWDSLGHTSVENNVSLSKDGGEATQFDSWWDVAIAIQRSPLNWSLTVGALELRKSNLDLAFGGKLETESTTGSYVVPSDIKAVDKALFVLAVQGDKRMGLYLPAVSITLGDAPSFDREALFELPLAGSILSHESRVMQWFHPSLDKAGYTLPGQ
jgi:hypothetical protein